VLAPVLAPLSRGGAPAGEVAVMVALHGPRAAAELASGASVPLIIGPTNIRRLRWCWLCPRLGHPCAALFLPDGAEEFLSRQAHGLR
jgi:hypothetical protein